MRLENNKQPSFGMRAMVVKNPKLVENFAIARKVPGFDISNEEIKKIGDYAKGLCSEKDIVIFELGPEQVIEGLPGESFKDFYKLIVKTKINGKRTTEPVPISAPSNGIANNSNLTRPFDTIMRVLEKYDPEKIKK